MTAPIYAMTATPQTNPFVEKAPLELYVPPAMPSLVGLTRAELADALGEAGVPEQQRKMRVQQLWHWIYVRGARDFDAMTSVSKDLRAALEQRFTLARPEVVAEQVSADGTRKWLLRLPGESGERPHEVECVYIPETDRGTLCLSSQVGCTLTCSFCHTGTQRLVRNLTAGEIVGQVMVARDRLGEWLGAERLKAPGLPTEGERFISNIVMMGMGEPLYNFDAVRDAIGVIADGDGLSHLQAPHHALDLGRGADDRARRRRDRLHAGGIAACGARRVAQRAGAAQPQISDRRTARRLPQLSRRSPMRGASPSNM